MKPTRLLPSLFAAMLTLTPPAVGCEECAEARALLRADNCKEAMGLLRKAARSETVTSEVHALRAICLARLDKRKAAAEAVVDFLALEPAPQEILEVAGEVTPRLGLETDESVEIDLPPGVRRPVLLLRRPPTYPDLAAEMGLEADIRVKITIGEGGVPRDVAVVGAEDSHAEEEAGFHEAAINAVKVWRFFPALRDGVPVAVEARGTVRFQAGG